MDGKGKVEGFKELELIRIELGGSRNWLGKS